MVFTKGIAVVTSLDWVTTNDVRLHFTYHAYSSTDVPITGYIETDSTISSLSLKADIRTYIINEYANQSMSWNTLLDDFVLVGGIL